MAEQRGPEADEDVEGPIPGLAETDGAGVNDGADADDADEADDAEAGAGAGA